MARRIEVELVGDSRSLERAFARSEKAAVSFNTQIKRQAKATVAALGVAYGTAGAVGFLKDATMAASNLNEQVSKAGVTFGLASRQVQDWAKGAAKSMGLAQDQAIETASSFGGLLQQVGIIGDKGRQQSEQLTQLGADLASFFNTSVQDALDAIRSGLVGESEPLRRYNVLLSESRVQAAAMAETGKKNARQLTEQDKVLGRLAIIFDSTRIAQGDYMRTSDGFANKMRTAQAETRNLQIELGEGLIPMLSAALDAFNKLIGAVEGLNSALRNIHLGFLTRGIAQQGGLLDVLGLPHFGGGGGGFRPGKPIYPGAPVYGPARPAAAGVGIRRTGLTTAAAKGFALPYGLQLAQARAEASGSQAQLLQTARAVAAYVRGVLPKLKGQKLIQAYGELASANDVIRSAAEDAARAAADAAQKAKDAAGKARQAAQRRAGAATVFLQTLAPGFQQFQQQQEEQRRAARAAAGEFRMPARLELAQARAEALGQPLRQILLRMRAAAYAALRSGNLAIQAQTDAWNAIAGLNEQLKKGADKAKRRQAMRYGAAAGAEYQFAYARGGPTVHIEHFHSAASSPRQFENELARRARARAHIRRGAR